MAEIRDDSPALLGAAEAVHRPEAIPHCRRIVVEDFLSLMNLPESDQGSVIEDAGIGVARMIDEHSWGFEIDVEIWADLQGVTTFLPFIQSLFDINFVSREFKNCLAFFKDSGSEDPFPTQAGFTDQNIS